MSSSGGPLADSAGAASAHDRVFSVQQAFTQLRGGFQGVIDLAEVTGISDSTVHRILQSGLEGRLIDQVARGRYRPGPAAVEMALHATAYAPSPATVQRLLANLHAETGGCVLLFAVTSFGGLRRLCTDYCFGDRDPGALGVYAHPLVNQSRSLRIGASGRAILAHLAEPLQETVLTEDLPSDGGPGVIRDNDALMTSLAEIRERGYAIGRQEVVVGWDTIASPVMWDGIVIGSVVLALPAEEMPSDLRRLIWHTCDTARTMSVLASKPSAA